MRITKKYLKTAINSITARMTVLALMDEKAIREECKKVFPYYNPAEDQSSPQHLLAYIMNWYIEDQFRGMVD